ncbi:hypothetical protein Leryth_012954 [Lithospermum erythrorhizon]|nr:hypothetical protein Leryth_012954 [Lithospermum erythrorhizon]
MDMFNFDIVKSEKAKAIFQYNLLKTFQTLFRVTELCLVIILVSWTSSRLPFALKLSGEYFRQLISILFNPFSIFIIGNIIVLCLLFKSGHLTTHHSPITITNYENNEVCKKIFIENSFLNPINVEYEIMVPEDEVEEVVFEDKETIYEETSHVKVLEHAHNEVLKNHGVEKNLLRVQSEKMERVVNISGKLRRSKTENRGEAAAAMKEEEEVHVFDELSNEEFQSAIETFIAKQVKFHKAEKLAIVLHSQA